MIFLLEYTFRGGWIGGGGSFCSDTLIRNCFVYKSSNTAQCIYLKYKCNLYYLAYYE